MRRVMMAAFLASVVASPVAAFDLNGTRQIFITDAGGHEHPIGAVTFTPRGGDGATVALKMYTTRLKDFFLSMREFKCLEHETEVFCHAPYPYPNPGLVRGDDWRWLEHRLLFLRKSPKEFGARLTNGVYFQLTAKGETLVGVPRAIDLNAIAAPPVDPSLPPYTDDQMGEPGTAGGWFTGLVVR